MNVRIMADSPIRFPGLFGDWAFTGSSVAFHIGGKAIYWYGIIIALGVLLALILAPLCAANLPCPAPVRRILRFLVQVLRSFPALILALLATFLFGLGTFSGRHHALHTGRHDAHDL